MTEDDRDHSSKSSVAEVENADGSGSQRQVSRPDSLTQFPSLGDGPVSRKQRALGSASDPSDRLYSRMSAAQDAVSRYETAKEEAKERPRGRKNEHTPVGYRGVHVDPNYYALNPWYGGQQRPVYGLAKPLPHQMRRPMLWGLGLPEQQQYATGPDIESVGGNIPLQASMPQGAPGQVAAVPVAMAPQRSWEERSQASGGYPRREREGNTEQAGFREGNHLKDDDLSMRRSHGEQAGFREGNHLKEEDGAPQHSHGDQAGFREGNHLEEGYTKEDRERAEDERKEWRGETQQEEEEEEEAEEEVKYFQNRLAAIRAQFPDQFAEFLATFITVFLGLATNLSAVTSNGQYGNFETECWGWGFATMVGIYVGGGISGACLNPAVTIAFAAFRGLPWRRCISYVFVQIFASFCAGGLAWLLYKDAIMHMDPDLTPGTTGKAFYSIPATFISNNTAFWSEFVGSVINQCVVLALGDDNNVPPGQGLSPLIVGLFSVCLTTSFSYNVNAMFNPARDLGPRLVCLIVGYGKSTFDNGWWIWGPWAGNISGALAGAALYDIFIFQGGESPVNFPLPSRSDVRNLLRGGHAHLDHIDVQELTAALERKAAQKMKQAKRKTVEPVRYGRARPQR